jgi:hypothetical protein
MSFLVPLDVSFRPDVYLGVNGGLQSNLHNRNLPLLGLQGNLSAVPYFAVRP